MKSLESKLCRINIWNHVRGFQKDKTQISSKTTQSLLENYLKKRNCNPSLKEHLEAVRGKQHQIFIAFHPPPVPWSAPHRGKFFSDSGENKSPISTLPFNPGLISSDNALLTFQIIIFVIFCNFASSCCPFRACSYPAQIRRCIKNWIFKEKSVDAAR